MKYSDPRLGSHREIVDRYAHWESLRQIARNNEWQKLCEILFHGDVKAVLKIFVDIKVTRRDDRPRVRPE